MNLHQDYETPKIAKEVLSEQIAQHTAQFKMDGGSIEVIEFGVSGMDYSKPYAQKMSGE